MRFSTAGVRLLGLATTYTPAMYSLWFKRRYIESILAGEKRDTIRARRPRFEAGDVVVASVGPVHPFALIRVLGVAEITPSDLDAETLAALHVLYPNAERLWRIHFRLEESPAS